MAAPATGTVVDGIWDDVLPALVDYIRIPNLSPIFDPDWEANGHMARAVDLVVGWCRSRDVPRLSVDVVAEPGRTPLVVMEVPATAGHEGAGTVLLYGHLDKQPEMTGWRDGLGPWEPVIEGDRLYGRGGADDGYAAFAVVGALEALAVSGRPHGRCVALIEASEESGSPDLPAHVDALVDRIGTPDLVVCLDSGCPSWDRLWVTTSLRGVILLDLRVDVLTQGVHSGMAGGIVPSSFRVLRHLLSRIEDAGTGEVLVPELHVEVPPGRRADLEAAAAELGDQVTSHLPVVPGAAPLSGTPAQLLEARTWGPAIATVGLEGAPGFDQAGAVLRPWTAVRLTIRVPPGCDTDAAATAMTTTLTADPPAGARVTVKVPATEDGWNAPPLAPWLAAALDAASTSAFGQPPLFLGEGGTIPFMGMLGARFPDAQFVVTGVLGPETNAHGPNEFLHLPTARRVTAAVADILAAHAER